MVNILSIDSDKTLKIDKLIHGDCNKILKTIPDNSINLIVTSPPYAYNRKSTYGGISIENYVEWFKPISKELKRVLKNNGSFVLNIKERAMNGERHPYVLDLILEMKKQGWFWVEEYIWHKKNCYPGKWSNRFRDAWERCLHFTKNKKFNMYQESVMVPIGDWAKKRLNNLSATDKKRDKSKVGSGFAKNVSKWKERDFVYPTNVLHLATECSNRGHSAVFPKELPGWFIKLFTKPGDTVLDPFIGSGTTAIACIELDRHYIGIELHDEYFKLATQQIKKAKEQQKKQIAIKPLPFIMDLKQLETLIESCLDDFYTRRLNSIHTLKLEKFLKRKNPYLTRATGSEVASEIVESLLQSHVKESDETIFGDAFFEPIAKFASGGSVSDAEGVDIFIEKPKKYTAIAMKSSPNCYNASQKKKQHEQFIALRNRLYKLHKQFDPILGHGYGMNNAKPKNTKIYRDLSGQRFWTEITGDDMFYLKLIRLMKDKPQEHKPLFEKEWGKAVNKFTLEFMKKYCQEDGSIDWDKLTKLVSEDKKSK